MNLNLDMTQILDQTTANSLTLTLPNPSAFTTIVGTPYDDTIVGNKTTNNTIIGGGGRDSLVAGDGNDLIEADITQVVYVDFPALTQVRPGDHVYTPTEQQAILAGLNQAYAAFQRTSQGLVAGYVFTMDQAQAQQLAQATGGQYATLVLDGSVVGGSASELDPGNLDLGGVAQINVSALVTDTAGGVVPCTSANFIGLTTTIAAHELGHLSGLQHQDAFGPIGTGIFSGVLPNTFFPTYNGPAGATETPQDIMASPESVGSTLLDAAGLTHIGERDAIKLAFNDTGTVLQRQNLTGEAVPVLSSQLPPEAGGTPFTIDHAYVLPDLPSLAVPNKLPAGTLDSGKTFDVAALAVDGTLVASNEEDFYAFQGQAGQVMNFQVISGTDSLNPTPFIPELVLVDSNGQVVAYNQHEFESSDSTLLDITLPASGNGNYYIGVDSYKNQSAGNYRLFLYSFTRSDGPSQGGGDTLVGGNGNDTLIGSSGNDQFNFPTGSSGTATILSGSGQGVVNLTTDPLQHVTVTGSVTVEPPVTSPTTTTLTPSPSLSVYGQTLTLNATVTAQSGRPTGTVSFQDEATGQDLGSATLQQLNGSVCASITLSSLAVGSHTIEALYTSDTTAFLNSNSAGTPLTVQKATPTMTWSNPADITYGTALGATQLDAVASWTVSGVSGCVIGTFAYSPNMGTVLTAGSHTLSVIFTPTDTTDYNLASATVHINVAKAIPTITWVNPADIGYGTALSDTQLNATSTWTVGGTLGAVAGTFTYTPAAGTVLNAGKNQQLSVSFAPTDTTDYNCVSKTVTINVNPATLTVTANNASRTYGTPNPAFSVAYAGFVNGNNAGSLSGTLAFTTAATIASPVGTYSVTPSGLTSSNYAITFVPGTLTVTTAGGSVYVLDPTASGALSLSLNAAINTPGDVVVDSSSASAISASGNASITAHSVQVVGGVSVSGTAKVTKTGTPSVTGDPLAGLPAPSTTGLTNYGAVNLSGNSSQTLNPGIYTKIAASLNAKLTLNPGIYIIEGGGLTATGNASISGTGVLIFNAGSNYPNTGGTYGSIALSCNGTLSLSAPTTGTYAGIVIFQSRDNPTALSLSGNAVAGLAGTVYAPKAQLSLSGNGHLVDTLIVDTLSLSGNVVAQLNAGSDSSLVYTPAQVRTAYGINNLSLDGTGQTIAIVEAYDDPQIYQALDTFDNQFGLSTSGPTLYGQYGPAASFLKVFNQDGQPTSLPGTDPAGPGSDNWEVEAALDVQWAHAIAPGAHIIVVEANSQSLSDLMTAVATAARQAGVSTVSMSWGFREGQDVLSADEAAYDSTLTTPGVTFVASTGDYGAPAPVYPAFSPNALAVGGTSLALGADGSYKSETGWGDFSNSAGTFLASGGGLSRYESEPAYQLRVQSTGSRTTPDVSFLADPATGAWIADPYNLDPSNPWEVVGGTSLSAPCWAGLIALVNQGRSAAGQPTLNCARPTETQQAVYSLSQSDYHVITSGSNGYTAVAGYNLVTGLGTPVANLLVPDLVAGNFPAMGQVPPVGPAQLVNTGAGEALPNGPANAVQRFRVFSALTMGGPTDSFLRRHEAAATAESQPTVTSPNFRVGRGRDFAEAMHATDAPVVDIALTKTGDDGIPTFADKASTTVNDRAPLESFHDGGRPGTAATANKAVQRDRGGLASTASTLPLESGKPPTRKGSLFRRWRSLSGPVS